MEQHMDEGSNPRPDVFVGSMYTIYTNHSTIWIDMVEWAVSLSDIDTDNSFFFAKNGDWGMWRT